MTKHTNPYLYVPSLYFMQSLPFSMVTAVSVVIYKNFNFHNAEIAFYTSLFSIPWFLKPLLAPLVENIASKTQLIHISAYMMSILFLLLTSIFSLSPDYFFFLSAIIFFTVAIFSTLFDMNVDGLYILLLDIRHQARFIGIRIFSYQIGRLACQGGLVFCASLLFPIFGMKVSWQMMLVLLALLMMAFTLYHQRILPKERTNLPKTLSFSQVYQTFTTIMQDLMRTAHLIWMVIFVVFYNLPENLLNKILPLFILDKKTAGGLDLGTGYVGILDGGLGISVMLLGVLLSGFILKKYTLQRTIIPITILVGLTNMGYLLMSIFLIQNIWLLFLLIGLAQFAFGLSNGLYMLFILQIFGKGSYPMSLFAIGTALMSLGVILGGIVSGYLQQLLGYQDFFILVVVASMGVTILTYYVAKRI